MKMTISKHIHTITCFKPQPVVHITHACVITPASHKVYYGIHSNILVLHFENNEKMMSTTLCDFYHLMKFPVTELYYWTI